MKIKNLVFYDFETTGVNPNKAEPLSLAFMISNPAVANSFFKKSFCIQFNKSFDSITKAEFEGLAFNHIHNQKDLDEHNKKSIPVKEALDYFVTSIQKIFNFQEFILIGYNNVNYDNKILNRLLTKHRSQDFYYILNNTYDVFKFISNIKNYDELTQYDYIKNFKTDNRKLETMYKHIFKKGFNAHEAIEDVKATLKLYRYFSLTFPKRFEFELNNYVTKLDLSSNLIYFQNAQEKIQ